MSMASPLLILTDLSSNELYVLASQVRCVLCGGSVREGLGCSYKKAPCDFYNMPDIDSIASNDVICDQNESYNIR